MTENNHIYVYGGAALAAGIILVIVLHKSGNVSRGTTSAAPGDTQVTANDPIMPAINSPSFGAQSWPTETGWAGVSGGSIPVTQSDYGELGEPVVNWGLPTVMDAPPPAQLPTPIPASNENCCCDKCDGCQFYDNQTGLAESIAYKNLMNEMYAISESSAGGY